MSFYPTLQPDHFYHVYNRGVDGCDIFNEADNYHYFRTKYAKYLDPVADTFAWCLMKNHFHVLIRVKSMSALSAFFEASRRSSDSLFALHQVDQLVSKQFASFLSCYTQSFNKVYNRSGGLFPSPFKRKCIHSEDYLAQVVCYIHRNPQSHGVISDFRNYAYSSFRFHKTLKGSSKNLQELVDWFGGYERYLEAHLTSPLPEEFVIEHPQDAFVSP
jgi:putative transposase